MNSFVKYSIILGGLSSFVIAGYSLYEAISNRKPGLIVEPVVHDCGEVSQGSMQEIEFKLTNNYDGPTEINSVGVNCHCSTPEISHKILPSGEKGFLKVKWNTKGLRGNSKVLLSLDYTPPQEAIHHVSLVVIGYVKPTVLYSPEKLEFVLGQKKAVEVKLVSNDVHSGEKPLVKKVISPMNAIEVKDQKFDSFVIRFDPEKVKFLNTSAFYIRIETNCENEPYVEIPFTVKEAAASKESKQ